MDLEVTKAVYYITRWCWPQVIRAGMGDIQELWGIIKMGFLEEEVKLSQEVKRRRNKNHRNSKQVHEKFPNIISHRGKSLKITTSYPYTHQKSYNEKGPQYQLSVRLQTGPLSTVLGK